jgi:hypothetical protein
VLYFFIFGVGGNDFIFFYYSFELDESPLLFLGLRFLALLSLGTTNLGDYYY